MIKSPAQLPAQQCEATDVADFGWGDPEYHECTRPATHQGWDYHPYFGPARRERIRVCSWHAQQRDTRPEFRIRFYRYRKVS